MHGGFYSCKKFTIFLALLDGALSEATKSAVIFFHNHDEQEVGHCCNDWEQKERQPAGIFAALQCDGHALLVKERQADGVLATLQCDGVGEGDAAWSPGSSSV